MRFNERMGVVLHLSREISVNDVEHFCVSFLYKFLDGSVGTLSDFFNDRMEINYIIVATAYG